MYDIKSIEELDDEELDDAEGQDKEESEAITKEKWISYWQKHLNSLKNNAKMLQAGGLDGDTINELVNSLEKKERMYLSDLNDFERAYRLLFEHPYKVMLIFSLAISFAIDLFAVCMSGLLYLLKQKEN